MTTPELIERLEKWNWWAENTAKTFTKYTVTDKHFAELAEALTAAIAALRAAQEDKERLEWLEKQENGLVIWRGCMSVDCSPVVDIHEPREEGLDDACGEELGHANTVRAAIDQARAREGGR